MATDGARRHWADDDDLADEIELYGELVVAASESDDRLTMPQIDQVLGVTDWPCAQGEQEPGPGGEGQPGAGSEHDGGTVDLTEGERTAGSAAGSSGERPVTHA